MEKYNCAQSGRSSGGNGKSTSCAGLSVTYRHSRVPLPIPSSSSSSVSSTISRGSRRSKGGNIGDGKNRRSPHSSPPSSALGILGRENFDKALSEVLGYVCGSDLTIDSTTIRILNNLMIELIHVIGKVAGNFSGNKRISHHEIRRAVQIVLGADTSIGETAIINADAALEVYRKSLLMKSSEMDTKQLQSNLETKESNEQI